MALIAHPEFSKRAILGDWLFCNFVRNKIYVLNETQFQVGLMARYLALPAQAQSSFIIDVQVLFIQ